MPNSYLLAYPSEINQILKTVPPGPIQDNLILSVLRTNEVIQSESAIYLLEKQKRIEYFKKNPNGRPISERLEDSDRWIVYQVGTRVEEVFPSSIVDEAMDVWKYGHYTGNSAVTFNKKYRKLQEAIFRGRGTYEQRLRLDTFAKVRELSPEQYYKLIESREFNIIIEYATLFHKKFDRMTETQQHKLVEELNEKIDCLIELQILPHLEPTTLKPLQQWMHDNKSNDKNSASLVNIKPQVTYRELKKILEIGNYYYYTHENIIRVYAHEQREEILKKLSTRPSLASDFQVKEKGVDSR